MKTRYLFPIAIIIGLTVLMSACNLPASRSSGSTAPSATIETPFIAIYTNSQTLRDVQAGTQTAAAVLGTVAVAPTATLTLGTSHDVIPTVGMTSLANSTPQGSITPTTNATPWPTSTPGHPATYTLQEGEYCYCIARRFNVNPADLISANSVCSASYQTPGTVLTIPQSGSFPADRSRVAHPATYTVRAGDTIYSIACDYGDVDPNVIIAANGLTSPYTLTSGTTLNIP